jgi:glycosyltransferase involved in cell wall biosynthesis
VTRPLVLSYYFPPIGGAGAQRPAKFVRYLHELGHDPVVVTGSGESIGRWTPRDETLVAEIPPDVDVLRVDGEPLESTRWESRSERWLGISSAWTRWWVSAAVEASAAVGDADVVYALMSPYSTAEAAAKVASHLGKPWIADLGDPWALDEMMLYPTRLHWRRELATMRRVLGTAAAIVMTTPEAARRMREALPELADRPIVSIPCGFDPRDFDGPPPSRADSLFRIVHTGYLHTDLGMQQRRQAVIRRVVGGGMRGVDILTRSHVHVLAAIEKLAARRPELADRVELHLAGVLSKADRELAEQSRFIRASGYLPHRETVQLMRSADLLFLPMQGMPAGSRSATVPGKTYEYLASGRPILAAVPEGDTRDIVLQSGAGRVCDPSDSDAMSEIIEDEVLRARPRSVDSDLVHRFDYGQLTRDVAELLEHVAGRAEPGTARDVGAVPSSTATIPILTRVPRRPNGGHDDSRRLLLLAYYFPPVGGAGAQRSLKLTRYLPESGDATTVLTGPGVVEGRWTPPDRSLLDELPPDTAVVRVPGAEPVVQARWRLRANRWLGRGSAWSRWWVDGVVAEGTKLQRDIDVIDASLSPYDSAEAAAALSQALRKPWIASLRDPWALDEMVIYPSALHRRAELRRMRSLFSTVSAVVTTTAEAARRIREEFPELAGRPVVSIPNGYDRSDFTAPPPERSDGKFRVVHTGYLHTELGRQQRRGALVRSMLGGVFPEVDILTRSHVYLLQAIDLVIAREPELASVIEVHLAGVASHTDRALAERCPYVRLHDYLPHRAAVELMRSADLLFLPMQNLPPGHRSATVPGKTYEYLASRRPILGAVPEGDARDILLASNTASVCSPQDVETMAALVRREMERWSRDEPVPQIPDYLLERFERRALAAEYAALLDIVLRDGAVAKGRLAAELAA